MSQLSWRFSETRIKLETSRVYNLIQMNFVSLRSEDENNRTSSKPSNVIETRFFSNEFYGIYSEQVAKISSCTYIERDGQCDKVISSHDRWHENTPCLPYLKVAGLVTSMFILMTHVLTCAYPTPTPTTTNTTTSHGVFNQQTRQMPLLF